MEDITLCARKENNVFSCGCKDQLQKSANFAEGVTAQFQESTCFCFGFKFKLQNTVYFSRACKDQVQKSTYFSWGLGAQMQKKCLVP